jgi:hypothetical protein
MPSPQSGAIIPALSPTMQTSFTKRALGMRGTWLTASNRSLESGIQGGVLAQVREHGLGGSACGF